MEILTSETSLYILSLLGRWKLQLIPWGGNVLYSVKLKRLVMWNINFLSWALNTSCYSPVMLFSYVHYQLNIYLYNDLNCYTAIKCLFTQFLPHWQYSRNQTLNRLNMNYYILHTFWMIGRDFFHFTIAFTLYSMSSLFLSIKMEYFRMYIDNIFAWFWLLISHLMNM